jgi:hypothetical protein
MNTAFEIRTCRDVMVMKKVDSKECTSALEVISHQFEKRFQTIVSE